LFLLAIVRVNFDLNGLRQRTTLENRTSPIAADQIFQPALAVYRTVTFAHLMFLGG